MEIPRDDQKKFAKEIIAIAERDPSPETLRSLSEISSLLVSWVGSENSTAVNLSEHIYELRSVANGNTDTGWKDYTKEILDADIDEE